MNMETTIILIILAAIVGAAIAYLAARSRMASLETSGRLLSEELLSLKKQMEKERANAKELADERTSLMARRDVLESRVETLLNQMEEMKAFAGEQRDEVRRQFESQMASLIADRDQRLADLKTQYEQQLEVMEQRHQQQMKQQGELVREQVNSASEEILKKRSEELSAANSQQISAILTPLGEHLKLMREAVERSDREHTTTMERLDASIKANLEQAREVGSRADKLAQALTADNKTQGNFGELRLRTLLEGMGFEEGVQFEEQVTLKDERGKTILEEEQGKRMVPDVVLHFPDKRDVVIDSKMSMKAFEDYHNASTENDKEDALQRHLLSVRNHVKELAHKNYSHYIHEGRQKPDFVIMYVYNESALQLALLGDPSLYREAYDQGVLVCGSQNMYMMLRVLEMTWRQVRQAENQEEIMKTANELVNRVQLFYERFLTAEEQLKKAQEAFAKLRTTTSPTGQGIVTAANKLLKYGAKENPKRQQRLPKKIED